MKRLYALEILSKSYLPEKSLKVDENQFHNTLYANTEHIKLALFRIDMTLPIASVSLRDISTASPAILFN